MRTMIVKSSPWTVHDFETSLHPEYVTIRNLVRKFDSRFILVGIGGTKYGCFRHPTRDVVFYNLAENEAIPTVLNWPFSWPILFSLIVCSRPKIIITLGIFLQIPIQLAADIVNAHHIAVLIGEPFYMNRKLRIFQRIMFFLWKIALKRADAMLAISEKMKQDVLTIMRKPAKIIVYHYQIADMFRPGLNGSLRVQKDLENRTIVLTSCRIDRRKGIDLVISAAKLVTDMIPKATFVIRGPVGDAKYFGELRRMISSLGLESRCFLSGEICRYEDLPGILSSAEVFVHPSLDESLGLAIVEALACGIPVVATKVGGIPEIVANEQNGLLVEPNPQSIANAILRILRDTSLRQRLRQGAGVFSESNREEAENDFEQLLVTEMKRLCEAR